MTSHRTINWLLALLIAIVLSTSCMLDGPDDLHTEQLIADDLQQAVQTSQARP